MDKCLTGKQYRFDYQACAKTSIDRYFIERSGALQSVGISGRLIWLESAATMGR
jgi:hypothetical protein